MWVDVQRGQHRRAPCKEGYSATGVSFRGYSATRVFIIHGLQCNPRILSFRGYSVTRVLYHSGATV